MGVRLIAAMLAALLPLTTFGADQEASEDTGSPVDWQWSIKTPLRDGVKLDASIYRPRDQREPLPCTFTLTPCISQTYHDRGMYFGGRGYVFLTVDARGRGNSGGQFRPIIQEAHDGHDVVEWLARQPFCNGKVAMWGGSYAGYNQWATAKEFPPHLATIVPAAAAQPGVDFPIRGNISFPNLMQWLTLVSGVTGNEKLFDDTQFWHDKYREQFKSGSAMRLAAVTGPRAQCISVRALLGRKP